MSPRRSSRARTTQSMSSVPQHTSSSTSSVSSTRADRSVHQHQKLPSPRSSVAARAHSSEDPEGPAGPQSRRNRSSHDNAKDEILATADDEIEDDIEEEVTRCICGNQEYPGLPISPGNTPTGNSTGDTDPVDSTGWFIQCDICKVWQHGGCVGIMDEATSPEEYFCEQCRKDLHRSTTTTNGRKYSRYLPIQQSKSPHITPTRVTKETFQRSKESKASPANAESLLKGRRLTMNSRDAAYEEEQLRQAIEESKREGGATGATGKRKGKRSRSESEERNIDNKRQRTTSGSTSSASQSKSRRLDADSEEETEKPEKYRNIRGAAARNHRNKEVREREAQRERERTDTQSGCKGRAERRRDDESEHSPQPLSRTTSARGSKATNHSFIAPAPPDHLPPKTTHKKTGRPPAKRGPRVGRNQYTKDRDQLDNIINISPARSNNSHDADQGTTTRLNGITIADSNAVGKPSKPRHMNPNRTTMNDMKRRVAGILEFISHTQVEMAGTRPIPTIKPSTSTTSPLESNCIAINGQEHNTKVDVQEGGGVKRVNSILSDSDGMTEQDFASLSSVEMMEHLTRRLTKWQSVYGK